MTRDFGDYSIIPPSGYATSIPGDFSLKAVDQSGFPQHTFLGASVISFNMNGGFGDSSSTLSVELINDIYNTGVLTTEDEYHVNNAPDKFNPPIVGSPVFFKFGTKRVSKELAFNRLLDILYNTSNYNRSDSGDQLVFGGILQSFTENRGPGGNPIYSVQVVDPREILSNVILILNNYAGSAYKQKNMLNIYGFLEHNLTQGQTVDGSRNELRKMVNSDGSFIFTGDDMITTGQGPNQTKFPITGTGFSRRGPQGIPYYRVEQAVNALMEYSMALPAAYSNKGFGGPINFRNYRYVIDFGSLPRLPGLYYLDFDQINLLELALEICDVTSRDLYVSLLPVTSHPAHSYIYGLSGNNRIDGIIRLDAIDRSRPPQFGAIASFLSNLESQGLYVENKDVGYELSNIVTDRFIVGAQEVEMHYFSGNNDRDLRTFNTDNYNIGDQWKLETSLTQQILPYYGKLGKYAVTIPKGFGAYQQILLDSTSLFANGVGAYYVATEMELRCCLVSYERWVDFLRMYNDTYLESIEANDAGEQMAAGGIAGITQEGHAPVSPISNNYAVTVPRSVFDTYATQDFGTDNLPSSPCNPPYGYPLYYQRMTKLGIPEGGLTSISSRLTNIMKFYAQLKTAPPSEVRTILEDQIRSIKSVKGGVSELTPFEKTYLDNLESALQTGGLNIQASICFLSDTVQSVSKILGKLPSVAKENNRNAMKVYNFLRSIAEECLGKKFLVKIPKRINSSYSSQITTGSNLKYTQGPFGFKPRCIDENVNGCSLPFSPNPNMISSFLGSGELTGDQITYNGALKVNYNPISEQFEYNYSPSNLGGFFPFDLCANVFNRNSMRGLSWSNSPSGIKQHLIPQDLTHFINDQGRISPYVRFDNSQFLTFEGFNETDFTQQVEQAGGDIVPDIVSELDNTAGDAFHSFDAYNNISNNTNKQVAFVKCSVDENFYMCPKIISRNIRVAGQTYTQKVNWSIPNKLFAPCSGLNGDTLIAGTGVYIDSMRYTTNSFIPNATRGSAYSVADFVAEYSPDIKSNIITGLENNLDTDHVYALITLPGRVLPTKDARFRDGYMQSMDAEKFKHYMAMDTVKGLQGFDTPQNISGPQTKSIYKYGTIDTNAAAWMAGRKAIQQAVHFGLPGQMQANMPSPVYPDLVAIPLISKERCYGPWISSMIDSQAVVNIGGKIEFIKDENLSPWNYSGYDLMNQAGVLQASFSNSLLVASERGGFTIPGLPVSGGPSLCTALVSGGPLVTNISINVSDGGFRTTYQMDLYTASFGKLQKQKQDELSKISRERQRLRDERNSMIRKGLGKMQTGRNYKEDYQRMNMGLMPDPGVLGNNANTHMIASVSPAEEKKWSNATGEHDSTDYQTVASMTNMKSIGETVSNFTDQTDLARSYFNSAGASINDMHVPVSLGNGHPNMPYQQPSYDAARRSFYS